MSLWTVQQHEWLRALGHPVLLLAGDPALVVSSPSPTDAVAPDAQADVAASTARKLSTTTATDPIPTPPRPSYTDDRTGPVPFVRGAPVPERPLAPPARSTDIGTTPTGTPRTDASAKKAALEVARGARRIAHPTLTPLPSDDPLLHAIARASGLGADAFEAAARTWQIDLAQLRAEPLSKRVLWRKIRLKGRNPLQ